MGRIEVENESKEGLSIGIIKIPSSLTRKETALLAATVETVTRVGPCEAQIKLIEIRDVRETKRKKIIERAAELLKEWDQKSLEPSEIEEKIDTDIKLGEIIKWGPEGLPAGPEVDSNDELIIVEGRADVLNLLRIGIKNSIAVQGTHIPKSVIDLAKQKKSIIIFSDGDRGGELIIKELMQLVKVDFIARAPEGYEVEELTRKQLIKSLQNKRSTTEPLEKSETIPSAKEKKPAETLITKLLKKLKIKNQNIIIDALDTIPPDYSIGYNNKLEKLFEIPVKELFEEIIKYNKTEYLIIDGILTKRLLSEALKMKIKFIACKNKEEELIIPDQIIIYQF
ncbi:MAG: DNA primase DnaG [Promethearchaeota archaeon]